MLCVIRRKMIVLKSLDGVIDLPGLKARIPSELLGLLKEAAPWTSYVALTPDGIAVGACAFKSRPTKMKEVEMAYLTFPEFEKRGYGTAMARRLFEIADASGEVERVVAQTLREENSSVHICRQLGFAFDGDVVDSEDGLVWRWSKQTSLTWRCSDRMAGLGKG